MNVLIVGAGAVGVVYGRHMHLGGANVTFFVRPKYVEEVSSGLTYYLLNKGRHSPPVLWEDVACVSTPEEVAAGQWDQVWLCVSSTALRGEWLGELIDAIGDATLVMLQPGLDDRDYILERIPEAQLVQGLISFISYAAPLKTETRERPGFAYWLPPLTPQPFSGPKDRVQAVKKALRAGGMNAKVEKDAGKAPAYMSAVFMPLLVLLEAEDWSFAKFRGSKHMSLMIKAAHEALAVVGAFRKESLPLWRVIIRGWFFRLLVRLQRFVVPLDLETYFAYHFTKVGDQTLAMMETYIAQGREAGLSVSHIESLAGLLEPTSEAS